jgi:hypothetical protein
MRDALEHASQDVRSAQRLLRLRCGRLKRLILQASEATTADVTDAGLGDAVLPCERDTDAAVALGVEDREPVGVAQGSLTRATLVQSSLLTSVD